MGLGFPFNSLYLKEEEQKFGSMPRCGFNSDRTVPLFSFPHCLLCLFTFILLK
jgi:hypothetical protein